MAKDKKNNEPEIAEVEYIYNGNDAGFIDFLRAVYTDYLSNSSADPKGAEEKKDD